MFEQCTEMTEYVLKVRVCVCVTLPFHSDELNYSHTADLSTNDLDMLSPETM